jgi:hypothetical protein
VVDFRAFASVSRDDRNYRDIRVQKIYLMTVRPIRPDWLYKDDFVRGIYELAVMLKERTPDILTKH